MSENKLPLTDLSMSELEAGKQTTSSQLERTRQLISSLGTPSFEASHVTPSAKERVESLFDLSDHDNPEFINNAIRIGEVKKALTINAVPFLQEKEESVTAELEKRVEEKRQEILTEEHYKSLQLKVEKLQQLKAQGFLPTDEALVKATQELSELQRERTKTIESTIEPKIIEAEPVQNRIQPQKETISNIRQIEEMLLTGVFTAEEIAEQILGSTDYATRIHSYISKIELKLVGTPFYVKREKFEGEKSQRFGIVTDESETKLEAENIQEIEKVAETLTIEEATTETEATAVIGEKSPLEKETSRKESPLSHPMPELREKILIGILTGTTTLEDVLSSMGTMKNGRAYGRGQAWIALSKNINFLYIRLAHKRKNLSEGEIALWDAVKENTEASDNATAFQEFKNLINDFFHIHPSQKKEAETEDKEPSFPVHDMEEPQEEEIENPLLLPEEALSLAWMVKSHHDIVIKSPDGKSIHYTVPQEIINKCSEILRSNKPKGKLSVIDETSPLELRDRTLGKILKHFGDDEKALNFIEQHDLSVQEILYWLDNERDYVFELLLHQVTTEHRVNQRRLDLIDTARVVAGFNNGNLELLQRRIETLAQKEIQKKETVKTAEEDTHEIGPADPYSKLLDLAEEFTQKQIEHDEYIKEFALEESVEEESLTEVTPPVELIQDQEEIVPSAREEAQSGRIYGLEKSQPDIREKIQEKIQEALAKPEFSSDFVSGSQLSKAYTSLKGRSLDKLVEERVVSLVDSGKRNSSQGFSRMDAILAVLYHELQLTNKKHQKDLAKIVAEEYKKYQEENK